MTEGWIKISRSLLSHWIWRSDHRLKWWLDILLNVNHADSKALIRGRLVECKRGQSVMSLETWAKRWNVSKKTVKDFFELLQSDSMLVYENIKITTRITVCKYDTYQGEVNGQETKGKRSVNGQETDTLPKQEYIKNDKKKYIYSNFYDSEITISENNVDYIKVVDVLFGKNNLSVKLSSVLSMELQLSFSQFQKLLYLKNKYKFSITEILEEMENWKDLKKRKSVYKTFLTFLKNKNPNVEIK